MLRIACIAICVFLLTSCEKSDDSPPEITLLNVEVVGSESDTIWAGGEIQVSVTMTDDMELQDLRLEISKNTSNQDTLAPFLKNVGSWSELEIITLAGLNDEASITFFVPDTVMGEWTLTADVIDASGHKSETKTHELWVMNDLIPTMDVTGFDPQLVDEQLSVSVGGVITVSGSAVSETPLESLTYALFNSSEEEEWTESYPLNEATALDLNTYPIQLPDSLAGSFTLSILVTDIEQRFNCIDVACTIAD